MTQEQIESIEKELEDRGYRKWTQAKSAYNSDWEWSRGFHYNENKDQPEVQIMWRVWHHGKYPSCTEPEHQYGLDVCVLCYINHRVDLEIGSPERFSIDQMEEIAENYYQFCKANNLM